MLTQDMRKKTIYVASEYVTFRPQICSPVTCD